jgi:phosphopantothenoylcysteine decarboxylase / phosphopantothenate---cysteine ligase
MKDKKILIGITGSIAAYKIPNLVRLFTKAGAQVQVMMTPNAKDFVSPLVLATLTQQKVLVDMFDQDTWSNHVMLGRWADLMLIAPASCNTLSKMANGQCDNFLLATYMSATCPIMIAPAMDEDMWNHPATKQNIDTLKGYGHQVLEVTHGSLASGLIGMGRMSEPEELYQFTQDFFNQKSELKNIKTLVTAGPTYENIDPVRFIGNYSSGKMGIALAMELANRGALVELVLGPSSLNANHKNITVTKVQSAQQMYDASLAIFKNVDIAIMSAAVADYTPVNVANEKIKKQEGEFTIQLTKTKDILHAVGHSKNAHQTVVGFALESINEKEYALSKLTKKNADMIVLNSTKESGAGFGHDTNKITIFDNKGGEYASTLLSKTEIAKIIINQIIMFRP